VALPGAVAELTLDLGRVRLPLDAVELFGAPMPIEVELGLGKGRFLVEWASVRPDTAFIGVERCQKYATMAATRLARRGLGNVRVARTTAEDMLCRCLGDGSVAGVHVYFPDPWPKKRHLKRRLLTPANLERIARVLVPGGVLRIKTDHAAYAESIAAALSSVPSLVLADTTAAFAGLPQTHYELKFALEGRSVHAFALRRA
jgi:tRNA (guanine-N7-)-methyltransferase